MTIYIYIYIHMCICVWRVYMYIYTHKHAECTKIMTPRCTEAAFRRRKAINLAQVSFESLSLSMLGAAGVPAIFLFLSPGCLDKISSHAWLQVPLKCSALLQGSCVSAACMQRDDLDDRSPAPALDLGHLPQNCKQLLGPSRNHLALQEISSFKSLK